MIILVLVLAAVLRLVRLDQSLWLDEAINVLATTQNSFWDMVTRYSIGDFHPPGYFALLWIWTKVGGIGEVWARLPSVIFGILGVFGVYLLGKEMFGKRVALLSALFMALAPLHIYYSQEARMYSMTSFAATLSFYFFWRFLNRGNRGDLIGYAISNILVLYSDYMVYLIFPVQFIFLLVWQRNALKEMIAPWIINFIVFIPWLTIFPKQLSSGTSAASALPGWADVVGGASIKELMLIPIKTFFGRVSLENKTLYGIVIVVVSLFYGWVVISGLRKIDKPSKLLISWIIIPVVLAFIISFFIPILAYFRILFILPAFYLLLAKGVDTLRSRARPWRLAVAGICLVNLISLGVYYTNPKFQREDWKGAVSMVDERAQVEGLILFENNNLPSPFIYYSQNISPAMGGLRKIPAESERDVNNIPNVKNVYLFEYLVDITDPKRLLEKEIEKAGYKKINTLNWSGVGFVHHFQIQ